jgi:acetolactate synthase regulatory subunit
MESKMSNAKKSTSKKAVTVVVKKTRKPNALHEKLVKLFTRKDGATVQDVAEVKFYGPAIAALRIVERRGYKTNVIKKSGELSRYVARKA